MPCRRFGSTAAKNTPAVHTEFSTSLWAFKGRFISFIEFRILPKTWGGGFGRFRLKPAPKKRDNPETENLHLSKQCTALA